MGRPKIRITSWMIASCSILVLFLFVIIRYGFWFASNDDYLMRAILSGAYSGTTDVHTIHMSPILGVVLSGLYKLFQGLPWCGGFFVFVEFYALWLCCEKIASCFKKTSTKIISNVCVILFVFGFLCSEYVFFQFTLVAAVAADAAIFLLLLADLSKKGGIKYKDLIHPFVLYTLAILIREDVALLHLPFLGLAVVYKVFWKEKEVKYKKRVLITLFGVTALMVAGALLKNVWIEIVCVFIWAVVIVIWLIKNFKSHNRIILEVVGFITAVLAVLTVSHFTTDMMYSEAQWEKFNAFNEQRVLVYDYSRLPDYDVFEEVYNKYGVTREDYLLMVQNNFAFSDSLNAETLSNILEETSVSGGDSLMNIKRGVLNSIKKFFDSPTYPQDGVLLAIFLVTGIVVLLTKDLVSVFLLQLVLYGHILCWTYLYWVNRMPQRVTKGIYLAEIMLLLGICFVKVFDIRMKCKKVVLPVVFSLAAMLIGFVLLGNVKNFEETYTSTVNRNAEWEACKTYCSENKDKLFFLDTMTFAALSYVEEIGDENNGEIQNYDFAGGWITNSPLYYEKLETFGFDGTVSEHLAEGGELYFICSPYYEKEYVTGYFTREGYEALTILQDVISVDERDIYYVYRVQLVVNA